jgi:acyl-CoA reductase-like NAD-dependent aldehyde dehydrogenase
VGLELGGKDPLYVTDEIADLKKTANAVAEGCFYNNGQSCCAVERVYVHERVYDELIRHFKDETLALKAGDPSKREFLQGALTRPSQIGFLESQIEDALAQGAKILAGGKRIPGAGSFFEPTALIDVNHSMKVMREESFGPIIGIQKVKNDQEAITLMNDTEYGLTASVYSTNLDRAKSILAEINSGTAYINCCDRVSPYLPWSGRKHSGLGATLSTLGILAFTQPRGWHIRG